MNIMPAIVMLCIGTVAIGVAHSLGVVLAAKFKSGEFKNFTPLIIGCAFIEALMLYVVVGGLVLLRHIGAL